jgi:hypothetical protein
LSTCANGNSRTYERAFTNQYAIADCDADIDEHANGDGYTNCNSNGDINRRNTA